MSKYGIDYYGAAYYGANTLVDFSAAPFIATPYDYSAIQLTWVTPTGDWDYIRLVRNSIGFPVAADDGDLLFEDAVASSRIFYLDAGQIPANIGLVPGHPYYYSIFVRETVHSTWQVAGVAIGIAIKDYNTTTNMYNYLPTILTSQVPYDSAVEQDNDVLKRFLKLFALNHDLYKSQVENITNRYDVSNLNGILIPVFMRQFGMRYEPELGLKQSRIMLRNSVRLYQTKGSKLGLEEYIKAYAGYDNTISMGKNLMLDQNDSSFEQSIGSWGSISNATLVKLPASSSTPIPAYFETLSQVNFPNLQKGVLKVTATASADTTIALLGNSPRQYGIPVTSGETYTLTGYSRAGSSTRNVSASISWYDEYDVLISASSFGSATTNSLTQWNRVTKTDTAPSGAKYAVPYFRVLGTVSSEIHYFDAIQFEQASSATYFQDARQILITLKASRINELVNPNFEITTDNWNFDNATTILTIDETEYPSGDTVEPISGGAVEIYSVVAGLVTITSSPMAVSAGNDYTFSIYSASLIPDTSYQSSVFINWYDNTDTLISTSSSEGFTLEPSYSRPSVTDFAPTGAVTATVGLIWDADEADREILLDAALFEKSAFVNSFFDGSNGVASLTDLFWEGDVSNAGRSHYYKNRFSVQSRLIATLPDWLPFGSTFELFFAQPD